MATIKWKWTKKELESRIRIVDWVRDTINTPAEELGPEQLAQRTVDLFLWFR